VIRAVVSDFGGVLTAPLMDGFVRIQADLGIPPQAFGGAFARAAARDGRHPLHEVEVGAITEGEFLATLERELSVILERSVTLHGFGERYLTGLDPNGELFAYYRRLYARGMRLALLTNNVREWEPFWRTKLPVDEIFETVVDSGFVGVRKPDPAIYALVLERLALPADACVFVDDLDGNVDAAQALGFAVVHHRETQATIAELEALLGAPAVETRRERPGETGR
jgi:putative hydrolase of the HAD superfamily